MNESNGFCIGTAKIQNLLAATQPCRYYRDSAGPYPAVEPLARVTTPLWALTRISQDSTLHEEP
jgi:hypothetical protein